MWKLLIDSQNSEPGHRGSVPHGSFAWIHHVRVCLWIWELSMRDTVYGGNISFPLRGWKNEGVEISAMNVTLRSEISFQSSKCISVPPTFGTAFFIPQNNSVICLWHLVETKWVALRHSLKIESPISEGIKRRAGTRYPGLFAKQSLLAAADKALCHFRGRAPGG